MPIFDDVVSTSSAPDVPSGKSAPDFATVKERIFGARSKSSKRKPSPDESPTVEKDLEKIFAGENWEEVAALYFNARFSITGWEGFCLTEAQKKTLGLSLATTMRMLLKIDPGYIALIVFTANFGGLIAQKEVVYAKLLKDAEREKDPPRS